MCATWTAGRFRFCVVKDSVIELRSGATWKVAWPVATLFTGGVSWPASMFAKNDSELDVQGKTWLSGPACARFGTPPVAIHARITAAASATTPKLLGPPLRSIPHLLARVARQGATLTQRINVRSAATLHGRARCRTIW